jgi:hypothetical protein
LPVPLDFCTPSVGRFACNNAFSEDFVHRPYRYSRYCSVVSDTLIFLPSRNQHQD